MSIATIVSLDAHHTQYNYFSYTLTPSTLILAVRLIPQQIFQQIVYLVVLFQSEKQ